MKEQVKRLVHGSGLLKRHHRSRNRRTLTLVMLHRVLPEEELRSQGANPEWSLTTPVFERFLEFVNAHFNAIGFDALVAADGDIGKLPDRSLLLTFDDGWRDNYLYALPLLERHDVPAHLFVVTDTIGDAAGFWQERLYAAFARHPSAAREVGRLLQLEEERCTHADIVNRLEGGSATDALRAAALELVEEHLPAQRQMLSADEISAMLSSMFTVGCHGASHRKLGELSESVMEAELSRCAARVSEMSDSWVPNISFPHGSYSPSVLKVCRSLGMDHMFGSGSRVHASLGFPLQRIHLSGQAICDDGNRFSEMKTAYNLFTRDFR